MAAVAAATAAASAATPTLLYTPSSKAESDISTSPSTTDHTFKRSPINSYNVSSPSPPNKRPFFGQNGLFDGTGEDHYAQLNYPIQTSPAISRSPYYRRRPSAPAPAPVQQLVQPTQQDFINYSTYTENTPSYYKTMIDSYQRQSILSSNTSTNTASADFSSATAAVSQSTKSDTIFTLDRSSNLLIHNTDTSSSL
jgi:hypothetical protein